MTCHGSSSQQMVKILAPVTLSRHVKAAQYKDSQRSSQRI